MASRIELSSRWHLVHAIRTAMISLREPYRLWRTSSRNALKNPGQILISPCYASAATPLTTTLHHRQSSSTSQYTKATSLPYPHLAFHYVITSVPNPHDHTWEPGIVKCSTQALAHTRSPWQTTVPSGEMAVISDQREIFIQNNITSDEPLTPMNKVCSTTPSTSHDNYWQITLASDAPANIPQLKCPTPEAPLRRSSRLFRLSERLSI